MAVGICVVGNGMSDPDEEHQSGADQCADGTNRLN